MTKYTFHLPEEMLVVLKAEAEAESRTLPAQIRLAIKSYLASKA